MDVDAHVDVVQIRSNRVVMIYFFKKVAERRMLLDRALTVLKITKKTSRNKDP